MKLQELLKGVAVTEVHADLETEVASIVYDSRKAVPGCLFAAISGFASDGNRFIPMAVDKGAVVTVTAKKPDVETPYVLVASDRLALAQMACNFYGNPAKSMQCIGITGTNGKTSVTLLLKSVLEQTRGAKVGLIGTMGNLVGQETIPSERTTPESLELQQLFARMRDAGCQYAVMEVSSHAIALDRIGGVHYDVAAFTNLTEDHLDFHKTMDVYCDTKAELFRRCDRAVINADDPYAPRMLQAAACPVLTVSAHKEAGLYAKDIALHAQGVEFTAVCGEETAHVAVPIPGSLAFLWRNVPKPWKRYPVSRAALKWFPPPECPIPCSSTMPTRRTAWKRFCCPCGISARVDSLRFSAAAETGTL